MLLRILSALAILLGLALVFASPLLMMMLAFIFDAPGAARNPWLLLLALAMMLSPLAAAIGLAEAVRAFRGPSNVKFKSAIAYLALPSLVVAGLAAFMIVSQN